MNKTKLYAAAAAVCLLLAVVTVLLSVGGKGGDESSSGSGLQVFTEASSADGADVSEPEAATQTSTVTTVETAAPATSSTPEESSSAETSENVTESLPDKERTEYSFRSKKLFESHYQKHGAEFGDITKEEYLALANDMLNSDSDTILHKTEKEDGDDVFFDTETGYFLVLSTDGYIRTFFIPDKGIEYFNKQ